MVFETEIQARLRDVNLGGHVDSVEAIRILDEARQLFLRAGDPSAGIPPVLGDAPAGVSELVGSHRVEYHGEMRFAPFQPFLVRLWTGHIGRSSFTVEYELRIAADHPPAIVGETSCVCWDVTHQRSWPLSDEVRARLQSHLGEPVMLRDRPQDATSAEVTSTTPAP